ncbi:hypothetical protein D3C71_2001690 [compost metagenome]
MVKKPPVVRPGQIVPDRQIHGPVIADAEEPDDGQTQSRHQKMGVAEVPNGKFQLEGEQNGNHSKAGCIPFSMSVHTHHRLPNLA